jgi:G3E family GTPase
MTMRVEVLVITGFLGSGKTTLLGRMIAARALGGDDVLGGAGKLALIVNELGEVGIDGALLPSDMTRQVELPGGCICCVLNEDLDKTILDLLATSPEVSTIVIETTGVAEPLPIAWALDREPLASRVRLIAVVTLVDATAFPAQRAVSPAVDAQVAYGDVIVLTKTDLATPAQVDAARAAVAELAPLAPFLTGGPDQALTWLSEALADPHIERVGSGGMVRSAPRAVGHGIESVWVPIEGVVDLEELCDALAELPAAYVRVKGITRAVDGRTGTLTPHWAVVHRVGLRVSSEPIERAGPSGLVALGAGIDREALAACVARAMVSSSLEGLP